MKTKLNNPNPKITVFTPTYNRATLLKRCFDSLNNQTDKNFKWLIIDDGSTDNTKEVIEKIKTTANFEIIYKYQKNGGKHRAHNCAVKMCDTNYLLILDSDDTLSKNALAILNKKISTIDALDNIAGILGNRFDLSTGEVIGTKVPNLEYSSGLELYQKLGFKGDTLRLYKTAILKKYLFPEIDAEKFIYENVVFDQIDKEYRLLLIKEKLYYGEYQPDGYTNKANKLKNNNPIGYSLSLKSASETAVNFKKKVNWIILYIIWCKLKQINYDFKNYKNKFLFICLYPVARFFIIIKFPKFFFNIFAEGDVQ